MTILRYTCPACHSSNEQLWPNLLRPLRSTCLSCGHVRYFTSISEENLFRRRLKSETEEAER